MRIAPPIVIDESTRKELERLSRKRSMAARVVLRSRIVLLAVEGNAEQADCRATRCQHAHGGAVAWPVSRAWHRRSFEGRAPAWAHTQDHGRNR